MRKFAEAIPIMAWTSLPDFSSSYFNRRWSDFTGLEQTGGNEDNWMSTLHPDDLPALTARCSESLRSGVGDETECRVWSAHHGCFRWQLLRWQPIPRDVVELSGWVGVAIDIHDRKLLEDKFDVEVAGRTADMRRLLSQKEALLQEVHHRVRNNLQIVTSLLTMQLASLKDEAVAEILREGERRIHSIVMLYQFLYQGARTGQLDFSQYAANLVNELHLIYAPGSHRVRTNVKIEPVSLDIGQAIPCGLILNELVTNALKSARRSNHEEEIVVDLHETGDGALELTVADSVNLPNTFADPDALGLTIVEALTMQLEGELITDSSSGSRYTTRFPKQASALPQNAPTDSTVEAR